MPCRFCSLHGFGIPTYLTALTDRRHCCTRLPVIPCIFRQGNTKLAAYFIIPGIANSH